MTNKELQELLKRYPDDVEIYIPFDYEGDNYKAAREVLEKKELSKRYTFISLCDIDKDDSLIIS